MGSVLNPPRSPFARTGRPTVAIGVVVVIAAAALFWAVQRLTPSASFVKRVAVVNPTPYHLEVEVIGSNRTNSVTLGAIGREQTRTFEEILDQGHEWTFRFTSGYSDGGETKISRKDLAAAHWKITVPEAVAERLSLAGVPPSPHE